MKLVALLLLLVIQVWISQDLVGSNVLAANSKKTASAKPSTKPNMLYGQIDELSYICSSAGIKLSKAGLPSKVVKISLGSAAAYSGLKPGDAVLDIVPSEHVVKIKISRNGKIYQTIVATDVHGLREEFESRKIKFSFGDNVFDKDIELLGKCDVFVLLDRSLSMDEKNAGVPGDLSKWTWCKHQMDNIYLATDRVLPEGFHLVFFNNTYQIREGITLWDMKEMFQRTKPEGLKKNIGRPLEVVFNDYFKWRRDLASKPAKPLLVIVISDGKENIGPPLQQVLIDATKRMNRPGEVAVCFMQVGDSLHGEELFDDVDRNLTAKGGAYDIVRYKSFTELRNRGLLWEMINTVKEGIDTESTSQAKTD